MLRKIGEFINYLGKCVFNNYVSKDEFRRFLEKKLREEKNE